jgi:hypothetical protein
MSEPQHPPRVEPAQPPSGELVLAALERAVRHRGEETRAAPIWAILDHLGLARRGSGARQVRGVLESLRTGRLIEPSRLHGGEAWELTASGRRRLGRAQREGTLPTLPESPQHRDWRNARTAAGQEIDRFQRALGERLIEATRLLDRAEEVPSDAWFELAEALQRACRRLGSASHCLYEWSEPHDERADLDTHADPGDQELDPHERDRRRTRRAGRRNVRLWRQAP